jgi:excinuclease UvrABC helicase subunit UvrB
MYYHRYLSLFVLEEFPGVVRDTARNLRVLDMCGKFAVNEQDRLVLEQYRPYITMMHVRARASLLFKEKRYNDAMDAVKDGLAKIKDFFARFGQEDAYAHSNEVKVLKKFAREIRRKLPVDPMQKLQTQLERAVKREAYEEAARIRDEIKRKSEHSQ